MARPLRICMSRPGYHLTARCNERRDIYGMTMTGNCCGKTMRELEEVAGSSRCGSVATALPYLEQRRRRDPALAG